MKVISYIMLKGGVGKTTASVNTAVGLSNKGYKVLLIDIDPQGSATEYFFDDEKLAKMEYTIYDVLEKINEKTTNKSIYKIRENLSVVPSNLDLALLEYVLLNNKTFPNHLYIKKILSFINEEYDYVVIDCPPNLGLYVLNALLVSDVVVIPFKNDRSGITGYQNTLQFINDIKNNFEINFKTKLLFTMANRNLIDVNVKKQFYELSFKTTIRYQGKPATDNSIRRKFLIEDNASVSNDYKQYIDELEGLLNE